MRESHNASFTQLFADCLERKGISSVIRLMDWLQDRLPFEAGIVAAITTDCESTSILSVINHSYDETWVSIYQRENYISLDPVVKAAILNQSQVAWISDTSSNDRRLSLFFEGAKDHGLDSGITYVTKSRRPVLISVSNVKRESVTPEGLSALRAVGAASLEVLQVEADRGEPSMTEREREVLRWLVAGKNNYEIGIITGLSERTVKFHLTNIYIKMNVSNRYHAVAKAVRLGFV